MQDAPCNVGAFQEQGERVVTNEAVWGEGALTKVAAMTRDGKGSGINELQNAIEEALKEGLGYALDAEERAWLRVTQLEDALIELARHCPIGEIVRGRELAEGKIK